VTPVQTVAGVSPLVITVLPAVAVSSSVVPSVTGMVATSREPKPAAPPSGFPIWPLWFAALAFVHTRRAGGLLVLGMLLGALARF